jgi:TrmH family RNA methyltransferase
MQNRYDIESTANDRARAWFSLASRSERDRTRRFIIEGAREVERATRVIDVIETIVCPDYAHDFDATSSTTLVSRRVFDKLSNRRHPDGVACVARAPDLGIDVFSPPDPALVLVADGIEKPGNIGAILRTCDALGAAFLGSALGTDLTNPNVVRSAQGSLFAFPIALGARNEAMAWCLENTTVIVAHPDETSEVLWSLDLVEPLSIVIGAENSGVHESWLLAGTPAVIPMRGEADSLNASVTAAIFLAEAARQRTTFLRDSTPAGSSIVENH